MDSTTLSQTRLLLPWLIYVAYGLFGAFFWFSRDAARKRRLWAPYIIIGAFLFLGVMVAWGFPIGMVLFMVPVIGAFTLFNLRRGLIICDQCGATQWRMGFGSRPKFCSRCGASLDHK